MLSRAQRKRRRCAEAFDRAFDKQYPSTYWAGFRDHDLPSATKTTPSWWWTGGVLTDKLVGGDTNPQWFSFERAPRTPPGQWRPGDLCILPGELWPVISSTGFRKFQSPLIGLDPHASTSLHTPVGGGVLKLRRPDIDIFPLAPCRRLPSPGSCFLVVVPTGALSMAYALLTHDELLDLQPGQGFFKEVLWNLTGTARDPVQRVPLVSLDEHYHLQIPQMFVTLLDEEASRERERETGARFLRNIRERIHQPYYDTLVRGVGIGIATTLGHP